MGTPPNSNSTKKHLNTSLWVFSTYFTEGLPYIVVRFMSSVFFTDIGVREALLGFVNFLGIPWNLKFLWAPFVDIFGTKRDWILKIQLIIATLIFVIAILAGFYTSSHSPTLLKAIAFVFVGLAFIAATNDISVDGYYLEGITDKSLQAAYSGLRVLAYRIAVIFGRSVLVAIAGIANWFWGFWAGGVTMLLSLILHRFLLPKFESEIPKAKIGITEVGRSFLDSFYSYLKQKRVAIVLIFVATYKLGDEILFSMSTPFLMRELGVTKTQLSWLAGLVASFASVGGAMLGAYWIKHKGLKKAMWPITLLMNINILAYVILSELRPDAATTNGVTLIAFIHGYENIAYGLGTAFLMVYLMRLCNTSFRAAHYAIGSAIMSLGSTFIGGFSGIIVEKFGYTNLFLMGFVAAIPSMILLFWIPLHEDDGCCSVK